MKTAQLSRVLKALQSDDEDERFAAMDELEALDSPETLARLPRSTLDALVELIGDEDLDRSVAVIELVGRARLASATEALLARVASERANNPRCFLQRPFSASLEALARCAPDDPRVLELMVGNLSSIREVQFRQSSIRALMVMGRSNSAAHAALRTLSERGDEWERVQAHWALFGLDGDAAAHVAPVVAALASKACGEAVRGAALLALCDLGAAALPALDAAAKAKGPAARTAKDAAAMIRSGRTLDPSLSVRRE